MIAPYAAAAIYGTPRRCVPHAGARTVPDDVSPRGMPAIALRYTFDLRFCCRRASAIPRLPAHLLRFRLDSFRPSTLQIWRWYRYMARMLSALSKCRVLSMLARRALLFSPAHACAAKATARNGFTRRDMGRRINGFTSRSISETMFGNEIGCHHASRAPPCAVYQYRMRRSRVGLHLENTTSAISQYTVGLMLLAIAFSACLLKINTEIGITQIAIT